MAFAVFFTIHKASLLHRQFLPRFELTENCDVMFVWTNDDLLRYGFQWPNRRLIACGLNWTYRILKRFDAILPGNLNKTTSRQNRAHIKTNLFRLFSLSTNRKPYFYEMYFLNRFSRIAITIFIKIYNPLTSYLLRVMVFPMISEHRAWVGLDLWLLNRSVVSSRRFRANICYVTFPVLLQMCQIWCNVFFGGSGRCLIFCQ